MWLISSIENGNSAWRQAAYGDGIAEISVARKHRWRKHRHNNRAKTVVKTYRRARKGGIKVKAACGGGKAINA